MEHKKFEYLILMLPTYIKTLNQWEEWLNTEGADGWELTAVDTSPGVAVKTYIFKRPLLTQPL